MKQCKDPMLWAIMANELMHSIGKKAVKTMLTDSEEVDAEWFAAFVTLHEICAEMAADEGDAMGAIEVRNVVKRQAMLEALLNTKSGGDE